MTRAWRFWWAAFRVLLGIIAATSLALAKTQAVVRVTSGEHPYFGRVVLDAPELSYTVSRDGDHVLVRLSGDPILGELPPTPRNVLAIRAMPSGVDLTVPPGANVRTARIGAKVVIDIDDTVRNRSPVLAIQPRDAPKAPSAEASAPGEQKRPEAARIPPTVAVGGHSAEIATDDPRKNPPPLAPAMAEPSVRAVAAQEAAMVGKPATAAGRQTAAAGNTAAKPEPADASKPPSREVNTVPEPGIAATGPVAETASASASAPPPAPAQNRVEPSTTQSDAIQVWPVTRDPIPSGPVALVAIKARPPGSLAGAAVQIPFARPVGAALFSRGPDTFVVFDERRPIDLAALRDDPVLGNAVVTIYPTATVIHLVRLPGQSAMLSSAPAGWRVSIVPASPRPRALIPVVTTAGMTFPADAPGQIVSITDPQTGGTLMIGTQRASGQGVLTERKTPEFILPATGQGIVVEPLSDAIGLRITQAGFILSGPRGGLALSLPQPMDEATMAAAGLTRLFEFPRQTTEYLARRAKLQALAAAITPLLKRGPKRHALAESLLGLGMGVEAQTLLRVTMKDDPNEAASPSTIGLAAIAALLAGRPKEAEDLADPRLTGTDEIALWRAIQVAMSDDGSQAAAAVFATTAPLLFTYPAELRRRVLPLVLQTMILGGEADAAAPLLAQREHDPHLAYDNALLKQARGENDSALRLFDEVSNTRSMLDHARAGVRATELRLTMGQLDAKAAADALEKQLFAWRGDARDLALRLRIAELRRKSGNWRAVFSLLRGAKTDFPDHAAEIDRQLKEAFAAVPRDPALDTVPPTDLIALLEENAELMADGPDGEPMRVLLADKLMALDLPKRADPLLTKLMRTAPFGPARAGFGATLATLRLHEGDGDGAMVALSESNSADMGDVVRERRDLITAKVEAKRGALRDAVDSLSDNKTQDADEARAAILEQAQDWPGARDALTVLAARVVPDSGMLTDAQLGIVLRLATAAARADDDATLASLRERFGARIGAGAQGDMFRLLTAAPVRGTADLGRARTEIGLARAVAADLGPKKAAAKTP